VERGYALVWETDRWLSETVRLGTEKKEEIVGKGEEGKGDEVGMEVGKQVKEGERCGVCGSVDHEMAGGVGRE
ncbi:hypothetical protein, partial [Bacillus licheniformis]|uniref:hypothetical protein n=1 Tax=Bacillus licheniformis TaxID=1402 RepID=UPI001C92F35B